MFSKQFYDFFLNALQIVISSYYEDIETNLPIGKHTLRVFTVHDILKRLLAKLCLDVSFMCLSGFVSFRVIFTINVVERNVVAYCHAYIYC